MYLKLLTYHSILQVSKCNFVPLGQEKFEKNHWNYGFMRGTAANLL